MEKRMLILSGPTHEYIDPVRYIANASSGLMGRSLFEEARQRGWNIDFVSGPIHTSLLPNINGNHTYYPVTSAVEMFEAATSLFSQASVTLFAAAVADYRPATFSDAKLSRLDEPDLQLELVANPDIASLLGQQKRPEQVTIGFALQNTDTEQHAIRKLNGKNFDGIVINSSHAIGATCANYQWLTSEEGLITWGELSKQTCAKYIIDEVEKRAI
jgi:phosphopantothenoylcysteine decarboxylase/phosphopantothenate--cysteine ligase